MCWFGTNVSFFCLFVLRIMYKKGWSYFQGLNNPHFVPTRYSSERAVSWVASSLGDNAKT